MFDAEKIRLDFPVLHQVNHNGYPLIYLDNAATTQKPRLVVQCMEDFYYRDNANVHRGVHSLAARATEAYENSRKKVRAFLNAARAEEIIFVRGATEGINLVAQCFAGPRLKEGDEVLISAMEHHSNLVPWQQLCLQKKARLRVIPMNERGELQLENLGELLNERTCMAALVHISNALGTINPIEEVINQARRKNIPILIDAAQSAASYPIDVAALDCDFLVFSGHKVFGPTGIGVLYGKQEHLESMAPYQFGGEMIESVSFEKTTFTGLPHKFEAGTPHIAGAIGLGAAIDYIEQTGKQEMAAYLRELPAYAAEKLSAINGLRIIGQASEKSAIVSFFLDDIHPHDIATILNEEGIAIRAGHHCTQPIMDFFGIPGTARASFSIYNTKEEIDQLAATLQTVKRIFRTA